MRGKFNKLMNISLLTSVVICIIGLLLMFNTIKSLETISYIIGIVLILHGVANLIDDYKKFKVFYFFDGFTSGLLSIIFGIIIITNKDYLIVLIPLILGIWLILSSTFKLRMSLALKDAHNSNWLITYVLSILTIIAGLCMIFNPDVASITVTKVMGGLALIYGICDIVDVLIFKKNIKSIARIFE